MTSRLKIPVPENLFLKFFGNHSNKYISGITGNHPHILFGEATIGE
jgi:hypothetical protein